MKKREYFLHIAKAVAAATTCPKRAVGCVIVDVHDHIIATGYNGVAKNQAHCKGSGNALEYFTDGSRVDCADGCKAVHAEQNALLQCFDVNSIHAAYLTYSPCMPCAKLFANTSVKVIYYLKMHDEKVLRYLNSCGITTTQVSLTTIPAEPIIVPDIPTTLVTSTSNSKATVPTPVVPIPTVDIVPMPVIPMPAEPDRKVSFVKTVSQSVFSRMCIWNDKRFGKEVKFHEGLKRKLLLEEIAEVFAEMKGTSTDRIKLIKEYCDVIFVAVGSLHHLNLSPTDINKILHILCDSNDSKPTTPLESHEKGTKGDNFKPAEVNILDYLATRRQSE